MGWRGHPECLHIFSPPQSLTQILLLSFRPEGGPFLLARSGEIDPLV
jgi:hypothetical protein